MSAGLIVDSLKDLRNNKDLDRYDDKLCEDIKSRLDKTLRENDFSIEERQKFAKKNFYAMDKWEQVFPSGISKCLKQYFELRSYWAPQFDPRFPNQNQARNCFVNFVDYQRCLKLKGTDAKECDYFKYTSLQLCPAAWIEKWNEQLEQEAFPVKI